MRRRIWFLFPLISVFFYLSVFANAQKWSGILAPSRATDWSGVGVEGGIPSGSWTQCGSTITAYTGTGATINNAISSCGTNQYVQLGAGTFTISDGIHINRNNVVLRGMGADQTKLIINGNDPGSSCHLFYNAAFRMCGGSGNIGTDSPSHTANWTAGYSQGTSSITLSSTTGLAVGSTLFLDQNDDAADGWPAVGDLFVCATTAGNCASQGGGDNFVRSGRSSTMLTKVTAISGNTVTINPPVSFPNYRSSQSPGAWWGDAAFLSQNAGIEKLSIDFTGGGNVGVELVNCTNCWVKGLRLIFNGGPGSFVFHVLIVNGFHTTIADNYMFGPTAQGNTQYAITPHASGSLLIQNNILHHNVSPLVPNGPFSNSVVAYNFVTGSFYTGPGPILHNSGEMMNLWEGNNTLGFLGDIIHGSHFMDTLFRNHFDGHKNNPTGNVNTAIQLQSHNRFFNVIGNVMGDSYFTTYETDNAANDNAIYDLGWQGNASGGGTPPNDTRVATTLMRWGNYDTVNAAVRFVNAEVPSGITNFSNSVPASQTLPASFYLNARPSSWWGTPWGTPVWPPVGPDVSGGNISGYGGHANEIPARLCYENSAVDATYGAAGVRTFNATSCYTGSSSSPAPPTGLSVFMIH
jgi:hypothetical protein